jgi:hypothetical protein
MNTLTALNAYSQHSLSIDIRTSSGDLIELDFNNEKSLQYAKGEGRESFAFSSLESFTYHYEGNGIDAQDQKEIDAFLALAQPKIDNFVAGLNDGSSLRDPINKITSDISNIFQPITNKGDDNLLNFAKHGLVNAFDNAFKNEVDPVKQMDKIFAHAERFLEQLMKQLDKVEEELYL